MNVKYVIDQEPHNSIYDEPPAYVRKATFSPNHGWRMFEIVAEFTGKKGDNRERAQQFIDKHKNNFR